MKVIAVNSHRCRIAQGFFERAIGLLGRRRLDPEDTLILTHCRAVHTCWMGFAIDVLFLSRTGVILKIFADVPPWRLCYRTHAFAVLEAVAGWATRHDAHVGDRLVWEMAHVK